MNGIRRGLRYVVCFMAGFLFLMLLLVMSALIPRNKIQNNLEKSAEYLCADEVFTYRIEGVKASEIDRYADSILLNIAYWYDADEPLESVMLSSYYFTAYQNENDNLADALNGETQANKQYMRYWHGSIAIVRPLLLLLDIQHIYILNGAVLILLAAALLYILIKNRLYVPAVAFFAGAAAVSVWYVPYSLEYTWMFLVMLVVSLIAVKMSLKEKYHHIPLLFMFTGMVTNYLDFLTTETITLLVPMILVVWIRVHESRDKALPVKWIITTFLMWLAGYAGMWMMKWGIAALVLQENTLPYIAGHIEERVGGDLGLNAWQWFVGVIGNNVKCLFPAAYGIIGIIAAIIIALGAVYYAYVYHHKKSDYKILITYGIIGIVPYIRYIILHNHSYIHCFFTYRAQIVTIMAVIFIIADTTKRKTTYGRKKKSR